MKTNSWLVRTLNNLLIILIESDHSELPLESDISAFSKYFPFRKMALIVEMGKSELIF